MARVEGLLNSADDWEVKAGRHTTPHHTPPHHHHNNHHHHHTTPHHTTPHHTTPAPHHTTPHHTSTTPHHTTPRHTTPRHATPHHTTPHHHTPARHHSSTTPHRHRHCRRGISKGRGRLRRSKKLQRAKHSASRKQPSGARSPRVTKPVRLQAHPPAARRRGKKSSKSQRLRQLHRQIPGGSPPPAKKTLPVR